MIIQWRALFDALHVEWKDRGKNTSQGNINIACPWCRQDPSCHLAVSESVEAYYCWRDSRHGGRSFVGLLVKLGCRREDAIALLNNYLLDAPAQAPPPPSEPIPQDEIERRWASFTTAAHDIRCLLYLSERGFRDEIGTILRHDLRVAAAGRWANRLIIPIRNASGDIVSWTARALLPHMQLKYFTQETGTRGGLLYIAKAPAEHLVIVEGAMDALKVAEGAPSFVGAVALLGKHLDATKLLTLRSLTRNCKSALIALDNDVPIGAYYNLVAEIAAALRPCAVQRLAVPEDYKDAGDMPLPEVNEWLGHALKLQAAPRFFPNPMQILGLHLD